MGVGNRVLPRANPALPPAVVRQFADAEQAWQDADALRRHEDTVPDAIVANAWDRVWVTRKLTENGCAHV